MGAGRDADVTFSFSGKDAGLGTTLEGLNGGAETLFDTFTSGASKAFSMTGIFKQQLDKLLSVQAQMVAQSRTFVGLAQRFDVPIEKMGELQKVAFDAGITLGQLVRGMRGLDRAINDAMKMPGGAKSNALQKLGFNKEDIKAMGEDSAMAFRRIRDALREIPDEAERAAAAQEVLGANYSAMIPVIEQSNQALADAEMSAHKYSDAGMAAATATSKMKDDMEQDLKPAAEILTGVFGLLEIAVSLSVQGLMMLAKVISNTVVGAFKLLFGIGQKFYANVVLPILQAHNVVTGFATGGISGAKKAMEGNKLMDEKAKKYDKEANENMSGGVSRIFTNPVDKKSYDKLMKTADRAGMMVDAISVGVGGDANYINMQKERNAKAKSFRDISSEMNVKSVAERNKIQADVRKQGGNQTSEQSARLLELEGEIQQYSDDAEEQQKIVSATQQTIDRYNDATGKDKTLGRGGKKFTPQQLEVFRREQAATEAKLATKRGIAEMGPLGAEKQSELAVIEAQQEMINAQQKLADLKATTNDGEMEVAKVKNAAVEAETKFIEKQKAHLAFVENKQKEMQVAEFQRAEEVTAEMNKRDLLNKKRGGMVGRDMQTAIVEQETEKLRRMEEQMKKIFGNKYSTQAEKEAQKAGIDKQVSKVMDELDKLGGMQILYTASDAAKKGMGGGHVMIDNPTDIAKSTRDYIKAQYELMIANSKIPIDNQVPFQIRGGIIGK